MGAEKPSGYRPATTTAHDDVDYPDLQSNLGPAFTALWYTASSEKSSKPSGEPHQLTSPIELIHVSRMGHIIGIIAEKGLHRTIWTRHGERTSPNRAISVCPGQTSHPDNDKSGGKDKCEYKKMIPLVQQPRSRAQTVSK